MKIAPPELKPENRPRRFLFRVAQHTGSRVHKDQDYALSLIFPDAAESLVAAFADALGCPLQNFALAHRSAVRIRTIADLTAEQPLRSETDEVCLRFYDAVPICGGRCITSLAASGLPIGRVVHRANRETLRSQTARRPGRLGWS